MDSTINLRCPNRQRFQFQPASNLKSQRCEIAAIAVAIATLLLNRFRSDSAAILQSAQRLQIARFYCDFQNLSSTELESGNVIGAFLQTPAPVLDKISGPMGARFLSSTGLGSGNLLGRAQLLRFEIAAIAILILKFVHLSHYQTFWVGFWYCTLGNQSIIYIVLLVWGNLGGKFLEEALQQKTEELKKAVAVSEEKIQQRSRRRGQFSSSRFPCRKVPKPWQG